MSQFKNSTIYQIYTKSFHDSGAKGIGDIKGVTEKLDYLQDLGIDYIWMTPFFKSPQNDNGYDVADYLSIEPMFGTMEDVEELIKEADKRHIGLMFDMVFNHTSTQHEWFQRALQGEKEYMDYYIFKDGEADMPPTNWESKFGGNAWEYVPHLKKWYLHLFDVTQADLNWDNPKVREELKEVIRFWKKKGVKGFRFDVVNLISKPEQFENDDLGDGRRFYTDGPNIHGYLKELVGDTGIADMVTVGEMSSTSLENCVRYANPEERELSMVFNFHHLKVDYKDGNKWEIMEPDYAALKNLYEVWQCGMQEKKAWNALFWCNHDQPRAVSRFGDDQNYWKESAKMLATMIHMMRGTPYVFQGEELGMTNANYEEISDYQDVESTNYYDIMRADGKSNEEALEVLKKRSRDNGRTPMQWNTGENAGFTKGKPWLRIPENYVFVNVESEQKDADSILQYYKTLISLRKKYDIIAKGEIEFLYREHPDLFAYIRTLKGQKLLVLNNLKGKQVELAEALHLEGYQMLLSNYEQEDKKGQITSLREYESIVLLKNNDK
ncbi:MAG: alpha,alpha-phosphotrehalase [Hespellia sp.]|nr:alpha,alpha-phosphotrehalase [Hespellia sp.]